VLILELNVEKKCFTKVVELGLNTCKVPERDSSFAFPDPSPIV